MVAKTGFFREEKRDNYDKWDLSHSKISSFSLNWNETNHLFFQIFLKVWQNVFDFPRKARKNYKDVKKFDENCKNLNFFPCFFSSFCHYLSFLHCPSFCRAQNTNFSRKNICCSISFSNFHIGGMPKNPNSVAIPSCWNRIFCNNIRFVFFDPDPNLNLSASSQLFDLKNCNFVLPIMILIVQKLHLVLFTIIYHIVQFFMPP